MITILFFTIFLKLCFPITLYLNSNSDNVIEDGTINIPFKDLDNALIYLKTKNDKINMILIENNQKSYNLKYSNMFIGNNELTIKSSFDKAIIIIQDEAQLKISENSKLFLTNIQFEINILNYPKKQVIFIDSNSQLILNGFYIKSQIIQKIPIFKLIDCSVLNIINSEFSKNKIEDSTIFYSEKTLLITIDNSNFNQNELESSFFFNTSYSKFSISKTIMNGNILKTKEDSIFSFISADLDLNIFNCTISNNIISNQTFLNITGSKASIITISQSFFLKNTAETNFPLLFEISGNLKQFICDNTVFKHNYGQTELFAIKNTLEIISLNLLTFSKNFGSNHILLNLVEKIIVENCNFLENNNYNYEYNLPTILNKYPGPAFYAKDFYSIRISMSEFSISYANSDITGIILEQSLNFITTINKKQELSILSKFICRDNKVMNNNTFIFNIGNCLFLNMESPLQIIDSQFLRNKIFAVQGSIYGGNPCIYSINVNSIIYISNSLFEENMAFSQSNCINFIGNKLEINFTTFNKQSYSSVEPYLDNAGGSLNMAGENLILFTVDFLNNKAAKGAGIFFRNTGQGKFQTFKCDEVKISYNSGIQTSAIEFDVTLLYGNFYITNSEIIGNKVSFYATIASFYYTEFNLFFNYCVFKNNYGTSVGSVYGAFHFGGLIYFNSSIFIGNKVDIDPFVGGSVGLYYGTTPSTIGYYTNCTYIDNYSAKKAGVHAVLFGQVYEFNCTYLNNSALYGGAVIVTMYSKYNITNGLIQKGTSSYGGVYIFTDAAIVNIKNSTYIGNHANIGACFVVDGFQIVIEISGSIFKDNYGQEGVIIDLSNIRSVLTIIKNCEFYNNTSEKSLLNTGNCLVWFNDSVFNNNIGRIISTTKMNLIMRNISVFNHQCVIIGYEGCLGSFIEESIVNVEIIKISSISSVFSNDFFSIRNSDFDGKNFLFNDVNSLSNSLLIYGNDADINLGFSIIEKLNKSLIYAEQQSIVKIDNWNLSDIIDEYSLIGIIECLNCLEITITNNIFKNLKSTKSAILNIINLISWTNKTFRIENNSFVNCNGIFGGGIYIENQDILLNNNKFEKNKADEGGAIFFKCSLKLDCFWDLTSNIFDSNEAKKGGAFHSETKTPSFLNKSNIFLNNKAIYGENYSSFPVKLGLIVGEDLNIIKECKDDCFIDKVASGQNFPNFKIAVLDTYNQKMKLADGFAFLEFFNKDDYDTRLLQVISESNNTNTDLYYLRGVKTSKSNEGIFNFESAYIIGKPNTSVSMMIQTDLIQNFPKEFIKESSEHLNNLKTNQYNFVLPVNIRLCKRGEIYIEETNICYLCPAGKYSLNVNDTSCQDCPANVNCDQGGDKLILDPGYWRSSNSSDKIYKCNTMSNPCLGGYNSSCFNGYTGITCAACIFNEDQKFFKKGMFYCEECNNLYVYIIILIIVVILIFGFIAFLVVSKRGNDQTSYLLVKMITTHFQTLSFVSNIKIELPAFLTNVNSIQAPVTSSDSLFFTLDCFREAFNSLYLMKLMLSLIVIISVILLVIVFWLIRGGHKKYPKRKIFLNLVNSLVVIGSFFQPPFINFYIQNMSCDTFEDKQYLTFNVEQECWNSTHLTFSLIITIPLLLLLMLIYPGWFFIYMRRNKDKLNDESVYQLTRFFQVGYSDKKYYWEFVQMTRKFSIILLTTFLRNQKEAVIYILIPVVAFFFFIQIYNKPYNVMKFNNLEILSLNACFVTYYSTVYYLRVVTDSAKTFFLVIILIANIVFLLFWIKEYIIVIKGKAQDLVKKLSSFQRAKSSRRKDINKISEKSNKSTDKFKNSEKDSKKKIETMTEK